MVALVTLRAHLAKPTAWGRVLLLSAFACALIVGLLAMHTIASAGGHHEPAPHFATAAESVESSVGAGTTALDHCDGPCNPAPGPAAMACILALLVGVLVIGASRRISRWSYLQPTATSAAGSGIRPSPRALPPPDLDVLSISRT